MPSSGTLDVMSRWSMEILFPGSKPSSKGGGCFAATVLSEQRITNNLVSPTTSTIRQASDPFSVLAYSHVRMYVQ